MSNDSMKTIRTQVRNGWGVSTNPANLADVFAVYDQATRTKLLNEIDAGSDSFDGDNPRESADNLSLRIKLEAMHQALMKAGR